MVLIKHKQNEKDTSFICFIICNIRLHPNQLQSGKKISSSTGVYTSYSFQTGESVKATSKLESESFNFFGYIDIGMHNFGHNKLVFGSPDIDVNVDAQIYKLNNGVFNIKGKVSGDAFLKN